MRVSGPFSRLFGTLALAMAGAGALAGPVHIENVATMTLGAGGGAAGVVRSNAVTIDFDRIKQPTAINFRHIPDGYRYRGLACDTSKGVDFTPSEISVDELAAGKPITTVDLYEAIVVVLDASASNVDPAIRDIAVLHIDDDQLRSTIRLTETDVDSGVFAGVLPPGGTFPEYSACDRTKSRGGDLRMSFDGDDYSLASTAHVLIDPEGQVFDSRTGRLIDDAVVTLIDDATGAPAAVYGDDSVSRYPSTVRSGDGVTDASGRYYDFLPGAFRFPLVAPGYYHLKIEPPPGYTAPSRASREQLATLRNDRGGYVILPASFGTSFGLFDPRPLLVDIPIDPDPSAMGTGGGLVLEKTASVRTASPGDVVGYRLRVKATGAGPVRDVTVVDELPRGLRYRAGSTRGAAEPLVEAGGQRLLFALSGAVGPATREIGYSVDVAPDAPVGEAINRAVARGAGGIASNNASAVVRLRAFLFSDAMTVIGRISAGDCSDPVRERRGVAGIRVLMEDGTSVVTDADGLYHIEGVRRGRHVVQMDRRSVPDTFDPVACDADSRSAGSAVSRFIEGQGGMVHRVDFQLRRNGRAEAAASAVPVAAVDAAIAAGNRADWLTGAQPGIGWLFPEVDHNPRAPAVRAVIRHLPGQRIALTMNGVAVDPLTLDGTDTGDGVAVTRWSGLPLRNRDNALVARVMDAGGRLVETLTRTVHYANVPIRATLVPRLSRLVADGLTQPLIAIRLTDRDGRPVREGTTATFGLDAPHAVPDTTGLTLDRRFAGGDAQQPVARVVGDDGIAFVTLKPAARPGIVRMRFALADDGVERVSEIEPWLAAGRQDWVVVGFGAGTVGYTMLKAHTDALPRRARKVVTDGQLAFYAKGQVRGSWLMTIAYDSDRRFDPDRGLLSTIDPDRYYTVYGDATVQDHDAPTRRKLYLRLERRDCYALFGDFETGFVDSRLTRYSRTLNGVKAEYHGRRLFFAGFAADARETYGRDEIQGRGLSGPYRLSARAIVPNSDKLRIETRDRFRSERILSTRPLVRHVDYDIDPLAGTLRFRALVPTRDAALNPVFIVVDYETDARRGGRFVGGGRAGVRLAGGRVEIGASMVRDRTAATATVGGIDMVAHVDARTQLRVEVAGGGASAPGARAYLAEVEHHGARIDLLAYARQQDAAFGTGQLNRAEAGTRKLGGDARVRIGEAVSIVGSGWTQTALGGVAARVAGDGRVEWRRKAGTLYAGGRFAADRGEGGERRTSRLLTLGGTQSLFGRLDLNAETQAALGGDRASVDFPVRHTLGAAYAVRSGIRLLAAREIAQGAKFAANTTRLGFDVAPWAGAKIASMLNRDRLGENGARSYAVLGLAQSLPIGGGWTIDATLDASRTLRGRIPTGDIVNPFHPAASGGTIGGGIGGSGADVIDGDYRTVTAGVAFRAGPWSWNARIERRVADEGDRWGLVGNALRTLGGGTTIGSSVRAYSNVGPGGVRSRFASADVAVALRPVDRRWTVLERFELRDERADAGAAAIDPLGLDVAPGFGDQRSLRAVNNLAVTWRTGEEGAAHIWEASLYHGAKYLRGRMAGDAYDGFVDMIGFDLRYDLGHRFDIGLSASRQHAWRSGATAFAAGPSIGISPGGNGWITIGYNIAGYRDRDFEADRYTRKGAYVTMRFKFDQDMIAQVAGAAR